MTMNIVQLSNMKLLLILYSIYSLITLIDSSQISYSSYSSLSLISYRFTSTPSIVNINLSKIYNTNEIIMKFDVMLNDNAAHIDNTTYNDNINTTHINNTTTVTFVV